MSKYTAQRRSGGGPSSVPVLIHIIAAEQLSGMEIDLTYSDNLNAGDFTGGDYDVQPSGELVTNVDQNTPSSFLITLDNPIPPGETILYSGAVAGVLTPDSKAIT